MSTRLSTSVISILEGLKMTTIASISALILAIARAIPALDRWLEDAILDYKEWKVAQDALAMKAAIEKSKATNSTTDINDLIKKDMQ